MEKAEVYKLIEAHYRKHAKSQVIQLGRAAGSPHNAEDVVQEAYTRACKYWRSYDPKKEFNTWWTSILNNCLRDNQRDTILNGLVTDDLAAVSEPTHVDPTDLILMKEIETAINKEPSNAREALKYYYLLGFTSKEVAEVTSYTADAVRQLASRFKRSLFGTQAA